MPSEVKLSDLTGQWRRSLITRSDGRHNSDTHVRWLQGPSAYIDLRQPIDKPDFRTVKEVTDLLPEHLKWLTSQLAFAGQLTVENSVFSWQKTVDLHPIEPDLGHLSYEGGVLVERALDQSYAEYWHRVDEATTPAVEVGLEDTEGREALLILLGSTLGFAYSRKEPLPSDQTLEELLDAQSARESLLDCEVSFSSRDKDRWQITRSCLPWHEGEFLHIKTNTKVITIDGKIWKVIHHQGDLELLDS